MPLPRLTAILSGGEPPAQCPRKDDERALQLPCTGAETPAQPDSSPPSVWARATDADRERAGLRLRSVARSDELADSGLKRAQADAKAGEESGFSASAVALWRKRVRGLASEARLEALLDSPGRGRGRGKWDGPGAGELWQGWCTDYLRPEAPDAAAVHRRLERIARAKGWALPTLKAFVRRTARDVPRAEVVLARAGAIAAMNLVPYHDRTVEGLLPLDILNGDGKLHDVEVVFPSGRQGRPVVWYWQDFYSRDILSYRAGETESAALVRVSLHEAIVKYGVPGRVVLDNTRAASAKSIAGGKANRKRHRKRKSKWDPNGEIPGLLNLLDIGYSSTAVDKDLAGRGVGRGRSKPIERAFGDLCRTIDTHPKLAGAYTGRSPVDRPETHRMAPAAWETFLAVVAECVAEHNARPGRRSEAAAGSSLDDAWTEGLSRAVVKRISPAQARVLLLSGEPVKIENDGSFHVNCGRVAHRAPNRYRHPALVERAGDELIARFDPAHLHDGCQVYDRAGRWLCAAPCLNKTGFNDGAHPPGYERARRQERRAAEKGLAARQDMDAYLAMLDAAPVAEDIKRDASPAAVRMVTGAHLPDVPGVKRRSPDEKASLLETIEAYRRLYAMSEGELGALVFDALGKRVVSLKSLNEASLGTVLSLLEDGCESACKNDPLSGVIGVEK